MLFGLLLLGLLAAHGLVDEEAVERGGHALAKIPEQVVEQRESFGLVLVERVALAVAAESHDGFERVELLEVFAPVLVDHLQEHLLLDARYSRRVEARGELVVGGVGGVLEALGHLFVGDAFLGGPLLEGEIHGEDFARLLSKAVDVPLLGIGLFGDVGFDERLAHVVAEAFDDVGDILVGHEFQALLEDGFALVVLDVIVF